MLLYIPIRPVCEQPSTETHPPDMVLPLITPHFTPHYCRHAPRMYFKIHLGWKSGYRRWIPVNPFKHVYCINMNCNCGKTSLSLPVVHIWYYACTRRIHYQKWSRNIYREWSPHWNIIGINRTTINSQAFTPRGEISTWHTSISIIRHTKSVSQGKRIFNGWIHQWHNHSYCWWPTLGRTGQKHSIIGDTHHIMSHPYLRAS